MSPDPSSHSLAGRAEAQAMALGFAHDGERRAFERFREELTPQGWVIAHNLIAVLGDVLPATNGNSRQATDMVILLTTLTALTALAGTQLLRRA